MRGFITKKLRFYLWWINALLSKHKKTILFGFLAGVVFIILGLRFSPTLVRNTQIRGQTIGVVGLSTPTNLPFSLQKLLSSGLTDVSPDGEVKPALALSWEASEGGKLYTFILRQDIKWHDGTTFSAYDVNYNLKDVEFVPVNQTTLQIKLKEPFAPLPHFLAKPLFKKGLIGVGSYKLENIKLKGEQVASLKLVPTVPDLPPIDVKFFHSEQLAKTAFKLGEVSMLDELSDPLPFSEWKTVEVKETVNFQRYIGILFDMEDSFLKSKEIRQALIYAIEKPEKNRVLTSLSRVSWAYTQRVKTYEQDLEQAKKLLMTNEENSYTLTLSTFPQYRELANTISQNWSAVGVKTEVKVVDAIPETYQALLIAQEIPTDPDQYPLWHSTQRETNLTHYSNPKIDKLLEEGRKEADIEKRKKIYYDFQRYLVEDAPAAFLFHPTSYTVIRK